VCEVTNGLQSYPHAGKVYEMTNSQPKDGV